MARGACQGQKPHDWRRSASTATARALHEKRARFRTLYFFSLSDLADELNISYAMGMSSSTANPTLLHGAWFAACGDKNGRTRRRGQSNREKSKTGIPSLPVLYASKKLKMYFPRQVT